MLSTPAERGFGLIELMVAMFVSLIVMAIFLMLFRSAFLNTSDNDAKSISAARLTEALDRLGDDLRSARSAARADIATISTRDDLRTRMRADPARYGDIVHASGRRFAVWTDSESDPTGPRCATYSLEQVMDDRLVWALVRRSGPPGGPCPAAANVQAETLVLLGTSPPASNAFEYGVLRPTATPGSCRMQMASPGAGSLNATDRLRIASIDVDLGSIGTRRAKSRTSSGRSAIDVWSRLNDDYYYAIGCAL